MRSQRAYQVPFHRLPLLGQARLSVAQFLRLDQGLH